MKEPPIYTVLMDLAGWSLDRTADIPKNARFTFGQRIDDLTLSALQLAVRALRMRQPERKRETVGELDLKLEELRALWRLVRQREWISQQQLIHVQGRLEEAGRMVGGWLKQRGDEDSLEGGMPCKDRRDVRGRIQKRSRAGAKKPA